MKRGILRSLNWPLATSAAFLLAIGMGALLSYSPLDLKSGSIPHGVFLRQAAFCIVALVTLVVTIWPNYLHTRRIAWVAYGLSTLALAAVLVFGRKTNGARCWFDLGALKIQPAEFAKIATVLALARLLAYQRNLHRWVGSLLPIALTALPAGLILIEPAFGHAMLFGPVLIAMLLTAGARLKHVLVILAVVGIMTPITFRFGLREYQRDRLLSFLKPNKVSKELRFQQDEAVKACAAGEFSGKGLGESGSSQPFYIAERHTDFVFTIVAEELGYVGSTFVLLLFAVYIYQSLKIAYLSREPYGRLLIVGLTVFTAEQVAINVGMALGVAPVTGLTLPFISYGGSSLVISSIALGLTLNVSARWVPSFSTRDLAGSLEMRIFTPNESLRQVI